MSEGERVPEDPRQETPPDGSEREATEEPGPLTPDDTLHRGPEPTGQAEIEGTERATGHELPRDEPQPETPGPGEPPSPETIDPAAREAAQRPAADLSPGDPARAERPRPAEHPETAERAAEQPAGERPARPARPAGERPQRPTREAAPAAPKEPEPGSIFHIMQEAMPGIPLRGEQGALDVIVHARPSEIGEVLETARNHPRLQFDYLRCLTAVDREAEGLEVVYHLYSFTHRHNVTLKCLLSNAAPRIETATPIWKAANWFERECWEMFGIEFIGHPYLEPLLLEEDTVELHPLRKAHPLQEIEIKQGAGIAADEGDDDGE